MLALPVGCADRPLDEMGEGVEDSDASETDSEGETEEEPYELSPEDLAEIEAVPGELEAIVEGTLAHFAQVQLEGTPHRCPHPNGSPLGGEAGSTPHEAFNCNLGPDRRCVPVAAGGGAGYYDIALWDDNSVWQGVGWSREEDVPHAFHYNLIAINAHEGSGSCEFTALAFADFDDDQIFSSYSISGYVDEDGAVVEPMVVEMPFE